MSGPQYDRIKAFMDVLEKLRLVGEFAAWASRARALVGYSQYGRKFPR